MPNAWPPPLQAAPPSAQANGVVIPNRIVPSATPRSIFIPLFIGISLVKESAVGTNSSVLPFHRFIHQVAQTREKVTLARRSWGGEGCAMEERRLSSGG